MSSPTLLRTGVLRLPRDSQWRRPGIHCARRRDVMSHLLRSMAGSRRRRRHGACSRTGRQRADAALSGRDGQQWSVRVSRDRPRQNGRHAAGSTTSRRRRGQRYLTTLALIGRSFKLAAQTCYSLCNRL